MKMNLIEISLLLVVPAIFALIVIVMIRSERKRRTGKMRRIEHLGFKPISQIPSAIQERVNWLHKHRASQELEIRNLATLERRDYTLFLLDLYDTGGDETSLLQDDLILLISSQLSLPRFTLFPRISQTGILADWANRALQALISRQGDQIIELRDQSFNQSFMLIGDDRAQIAALFDRIRFSSIQEDRYVSVEAGGDAFTYGHLTIPSQAQTKDNELREHLRSVERWYDLLRDASN
jgi:hypothetical protein